jgi:membrane protease YdiL (CAAX protease family)
LPVCRLPPQLALDQVGDPGEGLGALWMLALCTARRESELLGLRWSDVAWDRGALRVERQLKRLHGRWYLEAIKTGERGESTITLPEAAIQVLRLIVVWISRGSLASIYVRGGRLGRAHVIGIVGFVAFYVLTYRVLSHSRFMPVNGTIGFSRYLSLTPALLAAVGANGFLEELMFRGLLMSKLDLAFGPWLSTIIQAVIFASWHVGVSYAASVLVFVVLVVFPLGLIGGYLTRSSGSILPSSIFHAGADMPIYLGFLSYVS